MQRICFVLQVKPERLDEYKERHRHVWPEMQAALRETGWGNYSLFLREDGLLVGYLETEDFERARAGMASRDVNERWQREMADFFTQAPGVLPARHARARRSVPLIKLPIEALMNPNPALGVFFHWLGGLASGSFYVPYKGVKHWAWETYWLAGGFFSWIIAPWILASFLTKDLFAVLHEAPASAIFWAFFFGLLWGVGGLTFGLTMRYLGLSLGMAVVLGLCAAFGTLMPPIFRGEFMTQVVGTNSGRIILFGIFVCLAGITAAGLAGIAKERVMSPEQQKAAIEEFDLRKGIGVAVLSGVMSACFAYGLAAGDPIKTLTVEHGTAKLWQGLPVLVVVLVGGFLTNFVWCLILLRRNRTGYQFFNSLIQRHRTEREPIIETAMDAPSREVVEHIGSTRVSSQAAVAEASESEFMVRAPMLRNYLLCALAGTTWYFQFFFYTMGESQMGRYGFSSWTLHMASIIIFSSLWGIGFKEWKGAGIRASSLLSLALFLLVASTVIVGYGNYLGVAGAAR